MKLTVSKTKLREELILIYLIILALFIVLAYLTVPPQAQAAISYFDTPVDFWNYYKAAKIRPILPAKEKSAGGAKKNKPVASEANPTDNEDRQKDNNPAPPLAVPGYNPPEAAKKLLANPTKENARKFLSWFEEQIANAGKASRAVEQVLAENGAASNSRGIVQPVQLPTQAAAPWQFAETGLPDTYAGYGSSAPVQNVGSYPANKGVYRTPPRVNNQLIIYYFFSPRCKYCAEQSPVVEKLYREGKYKVLAIAMDSAEYEVRQYMDQGGLTFPVKMNAGESGIFGIKSYPAIIMATTSGKAYRLQGVSTMAEIKQGLEQALSQ